MQNCIRRKITEEQSAEIRRSTERTGVLAKRYGVNATTIKRHRPGRAHINVGNPKLSNEQIAEIQASSEVSPVLAQRYGVTEATIRRWKRGNDKLPKLTPDPVILRRVDRKRVIAQKRAQLLREINEIRWQPSAAEMAVCA